MFDARVDLMPIPIKVRRTRHAELVFLQSVESVGYVERFGAFGAWNVDAEFFKIRWVQCGSQ
jgi:hypothetical protein